MLSTDRLLVFALRLFGMIDMLALVAAAMPYDWLQGVNALLGFGTLPNLPIVEYLTRHVSLWYAVHAATFLFLSTNVVRYRPVIRFLAWLGLAFVACLVVVDVASGLPWWWAIGELIGGSIESVVLLAILWRDRSGVDSDSERAGQRPPLACLVIPCLSSMFP